MAQNGITIGRDITVTITDPNVSITFTPDEVASVDVKPMNSTDMVKPLNQPPIPVVYYDGVRISIVVNRVGPDVEKYYYALQAQNYQGVNRQGGTVLITSRDQSGVSEVIFTGAINTGYTPSEARQDGYMTATLEYTARIGSPL